MTGKRRGGISRRGGRRGAKNFLNEDSDSPSQSMDQPLVRVSSGSSHLERTNAAVLQNYESPESQIPINCVRGGFSFRRNGMVVNPRSTNNLSAIHRSNFSTQQAGNDALIQTGQPSVAPGSQDSALTPNVSQDRDNDSGQSFGNDKASGQSICTTCSVAEGKVKNLTDLYNDSKKEVRREREISDHLRTVGKRAEEKILSLEARVAALTSKTTALEKTSATARNGKRRRDTVFSTKPPSFNHFTVKQLTTFIAKGFPDEMVPLMLSVKSIAHLLSYDEVTESSQEESVTKGLSDRSRNWTRRCESLLNSGNETVLGNPQVSGSNTGVIGYVPMCPILLCAENQGFFTPRGKYPFCAIDSALWRVISNNPELHHYKSDEKWNEALRVISSDESTIQMFIRDGETKVSNLKRRCKNLFFMALGYDTFWTNGTKHVDLRKQEKESIQKTLIKGVKDEDLIIEQIDTTFWRRGTWEQVRNPAKSEITEPPFSSSDSVYVDNLFGNNAAREAYINLLGYRAGFDESVISLGRTDAWITTVLILISLPDGKGGARNCKFTQIFKIILPRCVNEILKGLRGVVKRIAPLELTMRNGDDYIYSDEEPSISHFELRINNRTITDVVYLPSSEEHMVYIPQTVWKEIICDWMGFLDGYIGRADGEDTVFREMVDLTNEKGHNADGSDNASTPLDSDGAINDPSIFEGACAESGENGGIPEDCGLLTNSPDRSISRQDHKRNGILDETRKRPRSVRPNSRKT